MGLGTEVPRRCCCSWSAGQGCRRFPEDQSVPWALTFASHVGCSAEPSRNFSSFPSEFCCAAVSEHPPVPLPAVCGETSGKQSQYFRLCIALGSLCTSSGRQFIPDVTVLLQPPHRVTMSPTLHPNSQFFGMPQHRDCLSIPPSTDAWPLSTNYQANTLVG